MPPTVASHPIRLAREQCRGLYPCKLEPAGRPALARPNSHFDQKIHPPHVQHGRRTRAEDLRARQARHRPQFHQPRRAQGVRDPARARSRRLHRRRRGARPAARRRSQGFRRRHRRARRSEVQPLFRRSHIIGRRFKLVHVLFGHGDGGSVHLPRRAEGGERPTSTAGCCATTSTARGCEDAARRDFTVNALYYDPHDETVAGTTTAASPTCARRPCCI